MMINLSYDYHASDSGSRKELTRGELWLLMVGFSLMFSFASAFGFFLIHRIIGFDPVGGQALPGAHQALKWIYVILSGFFFAASLATLKIIFDTLLDLYPNLRRSLSETEQNELFFLMSLYKRIDDPETAKRLVNYQLKLWDPKDQPRPRHLRKLRRFTEKTLTEEQYRALCIDIASSTLDHHGGVA